MNRKLLCVLTILLACILAAHLGGFSWIGPGTDNFGW